MILNRLSIDAPPRGREVARRVAVLVLLAPAVAARAQAGTDPMRLAAIKPTPLFAPDNGDLVRVVDVTVENPGPPAEAVLEFRAGSTARSVPLGVVKEGKTTLPVRLPEVREPTQAEFVLKSGGGSADVRRLDWRPGRRWTVYFVPITHHDLGYTDTIENVLNRYAGYYDDVLRFCDQTGDFPPEAQYRYTLEGTWSLQHFMAHRPPAAVDRFGAYVKEGRIEVGALFGNVIDSLCGHEQQIRLMYPSFRFARRYGGKIAVGSITDVPGLSWGLPTVLGGAGVKYFFAGLPTYFEWGRNDVHTFWDESAVLRHGRPDAFRWQGPDGQEVLVYYQGSYGFFKRVVGPDTYDEVMDYLPGQLADMEDRGVPFDVVRYIHNGVDNHPPDVRISHVVRQWNERCAYPKLVVATNAMFFEALEKQCGDVRTFRGELPHTDYVVGAISTARETAVNRLTHDRLLSAEKAATIAALLGPEDYPADDVARAYDDMLLYDEHTWGKDYPIGEIQDWAWNEKSHYAYRAAGRAEHVLAESLSRIAGRIRLEPGQRHVVVFNPLAFDRSDLVRVTRFFSEKPFDLVDGQSGRPVPYQVVELTDPLAPAPYAAQRWSRGQFEKRERFDLVFVAEDVPSMGYKTYRLVPRADRPAFETGVRAAENSIENRFFKVTLDPDTGAIASLYDKTLARELVDAGAPDKLNQLVARRVPTGAREGPRAAETRIGQQGPVYASLVARGAAAGCPQITQEVVLYDRLQRIDLFNRVLKDSTPLLEVYFAFPFLVPEPKFRFEGSNSVIEPLKDQFPGSNSNYYAVQHWAGVWNESVSVTLTPLESHLLEFGGLWPCYVSQAHHGVTPSDFGRDFVTPQQLTRGHVYAFVMAANFRTNFQPVQQADVLFRYCLTTHAGPQTNGAHRDFGWSAHNPLLAVVVNGDRRGALEAPAGFCRVEPSNVFLLTLKRAEDARGVIVRLMETDGRQCDLTLTVPHLAIEKAWRTNLVEEDQEELIADEHSVTVAIRPFGVLTLRLNLRSP
ncbi:MAG: hypothetical protein HRF43_14575 [Phycisphaerae bacterium]|jgi:hypothetical protein